jgi:hypothetical protein
MPSCLWIRRRDYFGVENYGACNSFALSLLSISRLSPWMIVISFTSLSLDDSGLELAVLNQVLSRRRDPRVDEVWLRQQSAFPWPAPIPAIVRPCRHLTIVASFST